MVYVKEFTDPASNMFSFSAFNIRPYFVLVKLNQDLEEEWVCELNIDGIYANATHIIRSSDGGYLVIGNINNFSNDIGLRTNFLIRISSEGKIEFTR